MDKLLEEENIANENISEENETANLAVSIDIVNDEKVITEELTKEIPPEVASDSEVSISEIVASEVSDAEDPVTKEAEKEKLQEESEPILINVSLADVPEDENAGSTEPAATESIEKKGIDQWNKSQIIERLTEIVYLDINETIKSEVEACKQAFYKIKKIEDEEAEKAFIAKGGTKEDFKPESEEAEEKLKELLAVFRDKKNSFVSQTEKVKEINLAAKKLIIEKLKELIESKDDFYKVYNEFRKLQQQWKKLSKFRKRQ